MKQVFLPRGARGLLATPDGFVVDVARSTYAYGISGRDIVGTYTIAGVGERSFCYDGISYRTLTRAGASSTAAFAIDGSNIVGFYIDPPEDPEGEAVTHGFLYNGSSFTTLDHPQVPVGQTTGTFPSGIEGPNVVGYCRDLKQPGIFGFLYDGNSFKTLQHPSATRGTFAFGISRGNIVGGYSAADGMHGYVYDGNSYHALDYPSGTGTVASGISSRNITGSFHDANGYHGFFYDGSSFKPLDHPTADGGTFPYGIDGHKVVGYFIQGAGYHGFLYDGDSYQTLDFELAKAAGCGSTHEASRLPKFG